MLRDVQNQYGSNLPTPFFLDFEKPHGFLAYALLKPKDRDAWERMLRNVPSCWGPGHNLNRDYSRGGSGSESGNRLKWTGRGEFHGTSKGSWSQNSLPLSRKDEGHQERVMVLLFVTGPCLWNMLPITTREAASLTVFNKLLKTYLFFLIVFIFFFVFVFFCTCISSCIWQ